MTKRSKKYRIVLCGRTKDIANESLMVNKQLCRKGSRICNIHNLLTPGLFTLSVSRQVRVADG